MPASSISGKPLEIINAPTNLGLRPLRRGHVPGAWRAPAALKEAGLHQRLRPARETSLERPDYSFEPEPGTRLGNGHAIRAFNERLAAIVQQSLDGSAFPLVIGGDCSLLLGCLAAARAGGPCGLIHADGHSDFFHPGNYDTEARLGSVAGMDLALATGRGEALLSDWGDQRRPLVREEDVVQIGERENLDPDYAFADIAETRIHCMDVRSVLRKGIDETAADALAVLTPQRLWLHVDVDILDAEVMPAVDSPGSPGLEYEQLSRLIRLLCASGRVIGTDVTIFDPDLDPEGIYARGIADCLVAGFGTAN
ncbi:arginase family protein [Chelativorans sp.]|uniref:arginase family protein n=1 Tax=Chelativorans sp. TaxID=2203393 RepID=UPI002810DE04|nr:arginase family protein [Chelativorans sp.]